MKQKWPILIFSALLTAFIVLAGIWGNAQFEHLHSGSILTAEHAAQGIAQELAHLHHGEITLQSEVGKGSIFTLRLPLLTD